MQHNICTREKITLSTDSNYGGITQEAVMLTEIWGGWWITNWIGVHSAMPQQKKGSAILRCLDNIKWSLKIQEGTENCFLHQ